MEQKKLTKADLRKVFLRSLTIMCSWNYERQMHMGFMCGMSPVLDKLYADDEERKKDAYRRHMEFFNCTPQMTPFIMGLCASMEEQNANSEEGDFQTESISMIKTSLMGPFLPGNFKNHHIWYRFILCTARKCVRSNLGCSIVCNSIITVCVLYNFPWI